jgi:hypothetical protein
MANNNTSNGLGLGTVLFIVFLILKLTGTIDWSWWWVTSPLWVPLTLGVVIMGIMGLIIYGRK